MYGTTVDADKGFKWAIDGDFVCNINDYYRRERINNSNIFL